MRVIWHTWVHFGDISWDMDQSGKACLFQHVTLAAGSGTIVLVPYLLSQVAVAYLKGTQSSNKPQWQHKPWW